MSLSNAHQCRLRRRTFHTCFRHTSAARGPSRALEKRWRPCDSRKTTSKDVRCTPTRCAASFFSLAACPGALLRPSNSACRQRAGRCAAENHRNCPLPETSRSKRTAASRFEAGMYGYCSLRGPSWSMGPRASKTDSPWSSLDESRVAMVLLSPSRI